jgi:hypothetical protein
LVVHIGHGASLADTVCSALGTSDREGVTNSSIGSSNVSSATLPLLSDIRPILTLDGDHISAPIIIAAATNASTSSSASATNTNSTLSSAKNTTRVPSYVPLTVLDMASVPHLISLKRTSGYTSTSQSAAGQTINTATNSQTTRGGTTNSATSNQTAASENSSISITSFSLLTLKGLSLVNLPAGPPSTYPEGLASLFMWSFQMDRYEQTVANTQV